MNTKSFKTAKEVLNYMDSKEYQKEIKLQAYFEFINTGNTDQLKNWDYAYKKVFENYSLIAYKLLNEEKSKHNIEMEKKDIFVRKVMLIGCSIVLGIGVGVILYSGILFITR